MNTLTIKNFGPIKDVTININRVNLLIGTQGSGKSTIAKLISIMNDPTLPMATTMDGFVKDYNLDFGTNKNTFIEYSNSEVSVTVKGNQIKHGLNSDYDEKRVKELERSMRDGKEGDIDHFKAVLLAYLFQSSGSDTIREYIIDAVSNEPNIHSLDHEEQRRDLLKLFLIDRLWCQSFERCLYIPAERNIVSLITDNFFALGDSMGLPKCIWKFGQNFEKARKSFESQTFVDIPFIKDLQYRRSNKRDEILYQGKTSTLAQGSSGFQSSVPLALVCSYNRSSYKSLFIIEEPEQNLYPVTQYSLVKFLSENCLQNDNKLLITTHSPYILTSFINLIQAHQSANVEAKSTEKIVPKSQWINFKDVSAYFINDGRAKDILDYEEQTIFAEAIDKASADISDEYGKLLDIAYPEK